MTRFVDLRSDTITEPTPEMRRAMAEAPVGDDVFEEDPTITQLERETAEILSMPAALYMPSGTMTNQVALRCHTQPGDEVVMCENAHIYYYECGGPAALSGVTCSLMRTRRGIFTADDLRAALMPPNLHMDGARLWNASAATGVPENEYAGCCDSVSVCFSKGLGAPVGSALAGSEEFIAHARRVRKMFGGGMRQAGIIAAGALHALRNHRERLTDDHANARKLAEALAGMEGVELNVADVETNIVFFRVTSMPAADLVARVKAAGVLVLDLGREHVRAVTNMMVDAAGIDAAIDAFQAALK